MTTQIKRKTIGFLILFLALIPGLIRAQVETLGIAAITPTDALKQSTDKAGKTLSLNRVLESLDSQLLDRFNATRKFQLVAESDLKEIIKKQDQAQSGNFDSSDKSLAQQFKLAGTKYYLVTTVDDFQDYVEKATFEGTGDTATKRVFRLSIIGKLYDSTTGTLKESANFQTGNDEFKQIQQERNYSVKDGELSDEMMVAVARSRAEKIANHVVDVIFPAKVIAKNDSDKEVTINRGDGAGVAVGDTFNVFTLGQEMIDPDTKESLGQEEVKIGKVQITEVDPKFSKAKILEDMGIVVDPNDPKKDPILRKPQ
jgi:multidrug efflux pump subunit AcrA (membrane-fusion protein)